MDLSAPLLMTLAIGGGAQAAAPSEYDRLRPRIQAAIEANERARDAWRDRALVLRGHTGDRTEIMGCDLFDPRLEWDDARLRAIADSPTQQEFAAWLERQPPPLPQASTSDVSEGTLDDWLERAFDRDQAARRSLNDPVPSDLDPDGVADQRWQRVCQLDMIHTSGVELGIGGFDRLSSASHRRLFVLTMHQDHRPDLQADLAAAFERLDDDSSGVISARARLTDRSRINLGLAQVYGELYDCETERPSGVAVDPEAIERERAQIGLAPHETIRLACRDRAAR